MKSYMKANNKNMLGTIYKISFVKTNKCYIGQTIKDPIFRLNGHIKSSKNKSQLAIHKAIRKYGEDDIIFEILETLPICSDLESKKYLLDIREIYYIDKFKSFGKYGYNLTAGGGGSFCREVSNKTRKIMSEKQTGRKVSLKTKKNMSEAQIKRYIANPVSVETRKKLSEINKNKHNFKNKDGEIFYLDINDSKIKNENLVSTMLGCKRSETYCKNLSKIHKNKVMVYIDGKFKKIDRNDERIISGELTITSNIKGLKINSEKIKNDRREKWIENNPNVSIVEIFNSKNEVVFTSYKSFSKFVKDNNLPRSLNHSQRLGGKKIGNTPNSKSRMINQGLEKYIGWYAKKVCQD